MCTLNNKCTFNIKIFNVHHIQHIYIYIYMRYISCTLNNKCTFNIKIFNVYYIHRIYIFL